MLLRAGLIYALSVVCLLLGGLTAWQRVELSARAENYRALTDRVSALNKENADLRLREESADRRARVAEDGLARREKFEPAAATAEPGVDLATALSEKAASDLARTKLDGDLKEAIKARDDARAEVAAAHQELEEVRKAAEQALDAADKAKEELAAIKANAARSPAQAPAAATPPAAPVAKGPGETGSVREVAKAAPAAIEGAVARPVAAEASPAAPSVAAPAALKEAAVTPAAPAAAEPAPVVNAPILGEKSALKAEARPQKKTPPGPSATKKPTKKAPAPAASEGSSFFPF